MELVLLESSLLELCSTQSEYPAKMVGLSKDLPCCNGKPYYPCYWVLFTNTPPDWLGQHIEYPTGACSPRKQLIGAVTSSVFYAESSRSCSQNPASVVVSPLEWSSLKPHTDVFRTVLWVVRLTQNPWQLSPARSGITQNIPSGLN